MKHTLWYKMQCYYFRWGALSTWLTIQEVVPLQELMSLWKPRNNLSNSTLLITIFLEVEHCIEFKTKLIKLIRLYWELPLTRGFWLYIGSCPSRGDTDTSRNNTESYYNLSLTCLTFFSAVYGLTVTKLDRKFGGECEKETKQLPWYSVKTTLFLPPKPLFGCHGDISFTMETDILCIFSSRPIPDLPNM